MARKIIAPEGSAGSRVVTLSNETKETDSDLMTPAHRSALARYNSRNDLISIADKVAGDAMFFSGHKWPDSNKHFPEDDEAMMRFVDKFYPHAVGGMLYVDEPKNLSEVDRCEVKRKIMKKLKLRYVVITRAYSTPDGVNHEATIISEALEQLE